MRLSVVVSWMVIIASTALSGYAWSLRPIETATPAATGMDILRAYKCRRAETKTIIVRGVEDNHSPAGSEPSFIRAARMNNDTQSFVGAGSYDQIQADRKMTDSFQMPANVVGGMFLIRMKPVANNENDGISIGDMSTLSMTSGSAGRFSPRIIELGKLPGWTRLDELYFAELGAIRLRLPAANERAASERTLLNFVQSGANDGWIDYAVLDDTSVDFAGVALCIEPPRGKGLSLAPMVGAPIRVDRVVALSCYHADSDDPICDPYIGDTSCAQRLPVACFRPQGNPLPRSLSEHHVRALWSGGEIALTEPVAGSSFATSREVDALCASRFGGNWRTARWHDGPNNYGIAGLSDQALPNGRVWIDIVDSPYATCWAR